MLGKAEHPEMPALGDFTPYEPVNWLPRGSDLLQLECICFRTSGDGSVDESLVRTPTGITVSFYESSLFEPREAGPKELGAFSPSKLEDISKFVQFMVLSDEDEGIISVGVDSAKNP